jgi:hypothetical protein
MRHGLHPVPAAGTHRGLQDPPSDFRGNAGVQVEPAQRLLDPAERLLGDRRVIGALEAGGVRVLEDGSQGDHRLAPQLLRPGAAAEDRQQRLDQLVVDHGELPCQLRRQQAVGSAARYPAGR